MIHPSSSAQASSTSTKSSKTLSLAIAYQACEAIARQNHENFPVASRFLPAPLRPHVLALYAFARMADNFADEPIYQGRRAEALDDWDDKLHRAYHGDAQDPIFVALMDTVEKFDLPLQIFEDLLQAFRMDLHVHRFATFADLMAYTNLAARPIGRALLYVFGVRDPERHRYAEELSTALALTNFWQDLDRDMTRGRSYLPMEDLKYFGVTDAALYGRTGGPAFESLMRFQCARTRAMFERARPLVHTVSDDVGVELALIWNGGNLALRKIERQTHDYFRGRPSLTVADKAQALAMALKDRGRGVLRRF